MRLKWITYAVLFTFTLHSKPLSVQVTAPSAILINAESGRILYAKEIHQKKFPASITKIATALYILDKKGSSLDEVVIASKDALLSVPPHIRLAKDSNHPPYRLETDGTMMGLRSGDRLTLSTLLYGLLLSSGNDAANVLAEAMSGKVDRFMDGLNAFLKEKGILETHFTNPHGLHHDDHWTTAYDMAQITRLALQYPMFREVVKTARYVRPAAGSGAPQYFIQHNRLLKPGAYYYPKAIGVKTGYHRRAGFTFVGAATHEGRTLIAVLLSCPESQDRFRDAIKLFESAFSEKKITRTLFASHSDYFSYRIRGADAVLQAILQDDVVLEYYPAEEPEFHAEIAWTFKSLPLLPGDSVGHLRCLDEKGNLLVEKPLFAANKVSKRLWASIADSCREHKSLLLALFLGGQVILLLIYFVKKQQKIAQR